MKEISATFYNFRQITINDSHRLFDYLSTHKKVTPEKIGSFEPLKLMFDEITQEQFNKILIDEEFLLTSRKKEPRQSFYIINVKSTKKENIFIHSILASYLKKEENLNWYIQFMKELFCILNPEYGKICHEDDWNLKNMKIDDSGMEALGVDLRKHLPGLYWANFFGVRYVEFFGRDRLLRAPAYKIEELANGGILLLTSESPLDFAKEEVRRREKEIIKYLGEEAFFSREDPPDKPYRAPEFNI